MRTIGRFLAFLLVGVGSLSCTGKIEAASRVPSDGVSGDGSPGDGFPGDGFPGDGFPGDGFPGDGFPGDGFPGDGFPGDGFPGDGFPGDGSPGDGSPGDEPFYIDPSGNDSTGDGSSVNPWKTLAHACSQVTTAGDTIFVNPGTYTEAAVCSLAAGVSIHGAGETSVITTSSALDPVILLYSAAEGTDGNQSVSHVKVDGALMAVSLVEIYGRSNVEIHHCTFVDAAYEGIRFHGRADNNYDFATTRATGNSFHDNTVDNCATYDTSHAWDKGRGNLCFGGQTGFLIYNNTITQPDRGAAANGYGIKFCNWGEHYGTEIYDNTVSVPGKKTPTSSGGGYGFAFELWSQRGGIEIHDNTIQGTLDFGGYDTNDDGGYGYAMKIYGNHISLAALSTVNHWGIIFEQGLHNNITVYRNYFDNFSRPISFSTSETALVQGQEDIYFYYNIFNNVQLSTPGWFGYCFDVNFAVETTVDNLQILNNVIFATEGSLYAFIESNDSWTTMTNTVVRNNIVCNANQGVRLINGTVTTIKVDNNDFYNVTATTNYTDAVVAGNTYENNITSDPLLTPTFHLQSGSPCIDAGMDVGLSRDYSNDVVPQGSEVDIGAHEYQD